MTYQELKSNKDRILDFYPFTDKIDSLGYILMDNPEDYVYLKRKRFVDNYDRVISTNVICYDEIADEFYDLYYDVKENAVVINIYGAKEKTAIVEKYNRKLFNVLLRSYFEK